MVDALGELYRVDGGELLEAALAATPRYVRIEVERLLPQLGSGAAEPSGRGESGQRDRLFAAVAELLSAVPRGNAASPWSWRTCIGPTRDPGLPDVSDPAAPGFGVDGGGDVPSDEAPLEPQVAEWLTHVRGRGGVAEVRLGPLSRDEVAEQVAELAGSPAPAPVVDELYARAEGNPFFTEQLVAAMVGAPDGVLGPGSACRRGWRSCWWRGRPAAA